MGAKKEQVEETPNEKIEKRPHDRFSGRCDRWPDACVGRVNPDGPRGACTAWHMRAGPEEGKTNPKSSLAYTRLSGTQVMGQDYSAAVDSFKQAIMLDASNANAFVGRSRELLALERMLRSEGFAVIRGQGGEGKTALAVSEALLATPLY
jgi:hypothetical protein